MRTFEIYFVFFMSVIGTILANLMTQRRVWNDTQQNDNYDTINTGKHVFSDNQQFYNDLLSLHNEYRKKHGVEPLVLDEKLCELAMKCTITCPLATDPKSVYGFNFFYEEGTFEPNANKVFFNWYNEVQKYTYENHRIIQLFTRSFTQIVWKSTTNLGLAVLQEKMYYIITAIYSPRGNILGEYMNNVTEPINNKINNLLT